MAADREPLPLRLWRGLKEGDNVPRWVIGASFLANFLFCLRWIVMG